MADKKIVIDPSTGRKAKKVVDPVTGQIKYKPLEVKDLYAPKPTEQKGPVTLHGRGQPQVDPLSNVKETAGRVMNWANTPVDSHGTGVVSRNIDFIRNLRHSNPNPSRLGAQVMGFAEGAMEGVKNLFTPLNLAFSATGAAEAAPIAGIAKAGRIGNTALSVPMVAEGVHRIGTGDAAGKAQGVAETAFGLAGMSPLLRRLHTPEPPLSIRPELKPSPKIHQGEVVDNNIAGLLNSPVREVEPKIHMMPDGTVLGLTEDGFVEVIREPNKQLPAPANPLPPAASARIRFRPSGTAYPQDLTTGRFARNVDAPNIYDGIQGEPFQNIPAEPNQLFENPLRENPQQVRPEMFTEEQVLNRPIPVKEGEVQPIVTGEKGKFVNGEWVPEGVTPQGKTKVKKGKTAPVVEEVTLDIDPAHLDIKESQKALNLDIRLSFKKKGEIRELIGDFYENKPLTDAQKKKIQPYLRKVHFAPDTPGPGIPGAEKVSEFIKGEEGSLDIGELWKNKPTAKEIYKQVNDFSKTVLSSMDMSALRQGKALWHTRDFWTSLDDMFKAAGSERAYNQIMYDIHQRPLFKPNRYGKSIAEQAGLDMPEFLNKREESMASEFANKIPGIRMSNRAYTAFLNKLRSDHFERLVKSIEAYHGSPATEVQMQQIAEFINNATGRGSLGKLENNKLVQNLFFAPKYMSSRFRMIDPKYYIKGFDNIDPRNYDQIDPFIRKQYWKSLAALTGAAMSAAQLYKFAGAETSYDPEDTNFLRPQIGNTKIDPGAGVIQPVRLFSRLARFLVEHQNEIPKYGETTGLDMTVDYATSRLNPIPSFFTGMLRGRDFDGQPMEVKKAVLNRITPIVMQDIMDLYNENPELLWLAVPAYFGEGVNTYVR